MSESGWGERIRTKDELLGKAIKDYINVVPQIRIFICYQYSMGLIYMQTMELA